MSRSTLEISCGFAPGPNTVEQVRLAEDLGYERAWFFDSPALYQDVWITMARAAEHTERIGLGTAVLVPGLRHPLTQASAIATVAGIAPGRVVVAIGTGFTGRMALGQKAMTWADTRTYIAQIKGLLEGEAMVVDGAVVQMIPPDGFMPDRPIDVPIVVAANGPKGFGVAQELGDGVMQVVGSNPDFDWCSLLAFGTVLDPGEPPDSERAYAAAGAAVTVVYHGMYESDPAILDAFPGGPEWRAEIEKIPSHLRHLALHEDHCVAVTERDRPLLSADGLLGFTWTGEADVLRERLDAVAEAGTTEVLYAPMGPDIPRELDAFMTMARG